MQPASFPIVAEARMAERLLEVERERLARAVAKTAGSRESARELPPADGRRSRATRPHSSTMTGLALAGCLALATSLVLGGLSTVALGNTEVSIASAPPPSASPMRPALVRGGWFCLSHGWCEARLSDSRVNDAGPTLDVAVSSHGDGLVTGTFTLPGPDGDWVGPVAVTWDDRLGGAELFTGAGRVLGVAGVFTLQGTAAYEGWAFVGAWSDPLTGEPTRVNGVIYEGRALDLDAMLRARAVAPNVAVTAFSEPADRAGR